MVRYAFAIDISALRSIFITLANYANLSNYSGMMIKKILELSQQDFKSHTVGFIRVECFLVSKGSVRVSWGTLYA